MFCSWSAICRGMRETGTLPNPPYGVTRLYSSFEELKNLFSRDVRDADVVVGSFVPEGVLVGEWVLSAAKGLRVFTTSTRLAPTPL